MIIDCLDQERKVNDICFNWNAETLALCSANNQVKIYSKVDQDKWELKSKFLIDGNPVSMRWAHPNFGNVIAVKTQHNRVRVYEEKIKINSSSQTQNKPVRVSHWSLIFTSAEDSEQIQDAKFIPAYIGTMH